MRAWLFRGCRVLVFAGGLAAVGSVVPAAAQTPPPAAAPTLDQRLERARNQIFGSVDGATAAIPELKAILAIDPTVAEAHMLLGVAYRTTAPETMIGEAKAELRQALDLNPAFFPARLMLAQIYMDLGRYESVRDEATTALAQVPGQAQFLALLGEAERRLGNPARSVALNRQALDADPLFSQARFFLGLALIDAGQRDEAIQQFERVLHDGVQNTDLYLHLGMAYLDAGRVDDAVQVLERGVSVAPAMADLQIQLARAYRLNGTLDRAQQHLTLAAAADAGSQVTAAYQRTEANRNLEWGLLRLQQGQLAAAATALRQAADMDPANAAVHRTLAEVYIRQGAFPRAREEAAQAATLGSPLPADLQRALDAHPAPPSKGRE
jgi:Tfp pilus assembly protein PilF